MVPDDRRAVTEVKLSRRKRENRKSRNRRNRRSRTRAMSEPLLAATEEHLAALSPRARARARRGLLLMREGMSAEDVSIELGRELMTTDRWAGKVAAARAAIARGATPNEMLAEANLSGMSVEEMTRFGFTSDGVSTTDGEEPSAGSPDCCRQGALASRTPLGKFLDAAGIALEPERTSMEQRRQVVAWLKKRTEGGQGGIASASTPAGERLLHTQWVSFLLEHPPQGRVSQRGGLRRGFLL